MGSPDVLSSVGHDFPSLAAGPTCPRGPGAAGPGLQGSSAGLRKWEWREPAGGGGRELWEQRPACRNRDRGRGTGLAASTQGGRGVAGKARESSRPGTRASTFLLKPGPQRGCRSGSPAGGKGAAESITSCRLSS